jgi:outer membrane protein assembly complex protein YaeT
MDVTNPGDPLLPPPTHGRHRSARERQRRGPMWGCLGALFKLIVVVAILLFVIIGGGWWYLGTSNFEGLIRKKVEETLEARLGRDVTIGSVQIVRSRPQKVIIRDLRIANVKGSPNPHFATVAEVVINGGIESFWSRRVKVGRVDIKDPHMWFEILPNGTHNFPKWKTGPKARFEIVRLDLNKLFVTGGEFVFLDRKHDLAAHSIGISSEVTVTRAEGLYAGSMTSPRVRVRLQDYEQFDLDLRGGFRYTPGILALNSIALRGNGIEAFLSGKLDPLTEAVYDLRLTSRLGLERVREIFRVEKNLEGTVVLDTRLRGKQGDFTLAGGWRTDRLVADVYELADAKGQLQVTDENLTVDVESARYGGGNVGAHYFLSKYAEPYPMTVDLDYDRISIEKLFNDFGVTGTGLRGAATGRLSYRWSKDDLLSGSGTGDAKLSKSTTAFSNATYPIPLAGTTAFSLDRGTITFRSAELDTDRSHVSLTGSLRIEDLNTNFQMAIRSDDFAELDRIGYNFAHAADKRDYELLGLGGAGTITGTVKGPIKSPQVTAKIDAAGAKYNDVLLGTAGIDLRYDGNRSVLTFDRALITDGSGRMTLTGTVAFPDSGPGPRFDIALDAVNYPAERAIKAVELKLAIGPGLATGRMLVAGTPESGRVTFAGLTIRRADSELRLRGDVEWLPGEGNVNFDLDIAARDFPVADLITFLDLGPLPVTGDLTGTLAIKGPKDQLEGSGSLVIRNGVIYGEPIDLASADIVFTTGRLDASNVIVRAPAGELAGEATYDFATEKFSYSVKSSSLDLSKLKLLAGLQGLLGGRVILNTTGAGTLDNPELVVEAILADATLRGLTLPAGSAPPTLYIAIRGGRLIVKGSIADIANIEGEGTVGEQLAVDGLVRITVTDVAKLLSISPATATLPASGNLVVDLRLGGRLSPIEALTIDGSVPTLNLTVSGHQFTAPAPLRFALREGRLVFEQFELEHPDSRFAISGFAEITGTKRLDINVRGRVEAALAQLFVPGLRAEGHVNVAAGVTGTLAEPRVNGTAELQDAQVRFPGFPQLISDITGTLVFRGDRIEVDSLRATVGGGSVVAGGAIFLDGVKLRSVRLSVQGTDVAIRYFEGLTVEGNFSLLISGDADRAVVQGDVAVSRALYFKDIDFAQSLLNVLLSRRGVVPVVSASWQDRVDLRLRLSAPNTLAVTNNIADVTGSAELDVTGTLANPVILGEVTLDEGGEVRFQNVDYKVSRGTIAFQNPFRIDPYFDVTLEGRVSGGVSEIESGPIDITVNLTGTIDRITPSITSDPPASDITLFSILGFGSFAGGTSAPGGANAALATQSLLYQSVLSALGQRILPFADSFTFDPNLLDTGQGAGAKVTFERRLSNNVRLLIVYNLGDHKSREVLEWFVTRDWTLQLTRDETQSEYRIDARFRRRYPGRWQWGNDEEDFATSASIGAAGDVAEGGAALLTPPPTTAVSTNAAAGSPIARIDFRADARFDTTTLTRYVTLEVGQPVSVREVQSSVKNLFATGNFRDIRVDATPGDGGTLLTFSLFLHYRVGDIKVEGLKRSDRGRAERELTIRAGEVLSLDDVDDSANAVQAELVRGGFLEATVDPETTFDRARSLAAVTFHVTPGPHAKIAQVIFEGDPAPYTTEDLIKRMRRKPGSDFNTTTAREEAERIRNFLIREEHRRADVDYLGHTYDAATKSVTLRYRAVTGPIVKTEVAGVDRGLVRRQLPFRSRNQEYSEDVIDRAATEMVQSLQQRGYFNAAVDTESRLENNTWITTFQVAPGQRFRLADVTFNGNVKLKDKELEDVVATSPRGGIKRFIAAIFRRPTGVTSEQLSDDRDALESYYRLQGFSEATVASAVPLARADGTLVIDFPISEGPQTLVTDISIEGIESIKPPDLPRMQLRPGQPLNPTLAREDIVALQTYYADRGYAEVQVAPRTEISADKTGAKLVYTITEGPKVEIDEVIVRGNTYTDSVVVLRTADLEPGEPFSYTSILEAQRNLYRLGIFQRVDVQPEQSGTTVGDRDVVIQVEEGRNLTISGAVGLRAQEKTDEEGTEGAGTDVSPRVAAAISHRNLFGTGRFLGLEAVWSREEKEGFLTYREPFIGRYNVPIQVSLYQTDDATRPGTHIVQRGTSIEATKVSRRRTRWSLRYEYKISDCKDGPICDAVEDDLPVEGLDRSLLNIQISSITPTFFWDKRDDIVNPRRGFFTSASVEYAFPLFSSKTHFLKEFIQGAWYIPISERTVVALSGRAGLIQPYRNRDDDGVEVENAIDLVPLSERFVAGGETSHRAFGHDLLGTICQDERDFHGNPPQCKETLYRRIDKTTGLPVGPLLPLGGGGVFLLNAEYRFPIFSSVGGALFADIGNVYAEPKIRFDELRYGVGVGIRYLSPVGPLRFDVGWPLQRRVIGFDDKTGDPQYERAFSYFITLGYAF